MLTDINQLEQDTASAPKTAVLWKKMYQTLKPVLIDEQERYYQPARGIIYFVEGLINTALIIGFVVWTIASKAVDLVIDLLQNLQDMLLDKVTSGQFTIGIEDYKNDDLNFHQFRKKALSSKRSQDFFMKFQEQVIMGLPPDIDSNSSIIDMTDDEYENSLVQSLVEKLRNNHTDLDQDALQRQALEELKNDYKEAIYIKGLTKLSLEIKALHQAVTKNLPEGVANKLGAIINRAAILTLAPVFLATSAILEASRYANDSLYIAGIGLLALAKIASVLLFNAPLYALDVSRAAVSRVGSFFSPALEELETLSEEETPPNAIKAST